MDTKEILVEIKWKATSEYDWEDVHIELALNSYYPKENFLVTELYQQGRVSEEQIEKIQYDIWDLHFDGVDDQKDYFKEVAQAIVKLVEGENGKM